MATPRTIYANAPITEAAIDVRMTGSSVTVPLLQGLSTALAVDYPKREDSFATLIRTDLAGAMPSVSQVLNGHIFSSVDGTQILQATTEGFTFTRRAPYDRWESLVGEAHRLWSAYLMVAGAVTATRIGVRFVNRIQLPGARGELDDYLRTAPQVSPEIKEGTLSAFFMQLQLPQTDIDAVAVINEALLPPTATGGAVLLDIDLFRERLEIEGADGSLWEIFEQLHVRKNEIFEACITDLTRKAIS